jgi:hypothetical protein
MAVDDDDGSEAAGAESPRKVGRFVLALLLGIVIVLAFSAALFAFSRAADSRSLKAERPRHRTVAFSLIVGLKVKAWTL